METTQTDRRTKPYRFRRMAGGASGAAALAVMAIMVLSPMASAGLHAAVKFRGGTPYRAAYVTTEGCAAGKAPAPGFSMTTGFGKVSMAGHARTCTALKGGLAINSIFSADNGLGVIESFKLAKAASSVAVAWNIKGVASDSAGGILAHCPTQTYSYSYNIGPSWVFVNYSYSDCYAEAGYNLYSYPEVYDQTTHMYYGPSTYQQLYNSTGNYHYAYMDTVNYSNSSYASNSSYSYSYNGSMGSSNTSNIAWAPTWYVNGTYNLGDHLIIYAELDASVYAEIFGEKRAHAAASFVASGTTGHVDLMGITVT